MKILYHHRTMADGAEGIHIREIVSALRQLGHDVRVVALAGDPAEHEARRRSQVSTLRRLIPAFAYEVAELAYNVVGYRRIMAAIQAFGPDVIYDRYNSYSTAAMRAARRTGLPLLLEVNAPVAYERSVYENLQLKFPTLARRYERKIFLGADRIFVVSTPLQRHLAGTIGIPSAKIVVMPNGADPDVFVPGSGEGVRRRHGLDDRIVIGFLGILRPWHGVDLLLEAFREVRSRWPAVHLLIVGDGPLETELKAESRRLGVSDAVTFTGRISHSDTVTHVAAMDVCVSPHATFYASPMKILEYMAMCKAVVAPDMENIRDIVDDGRTGLLFAPRSASGLAASLGRLIEDGALRRQLGEAGRREVVERFNWKSNAARIVEEAQALLDVGTGRARKASS